MANRYAVIVDGIVDNVIVAETPLAPNHILCSDDIEIGFLYDGTDFSEPAPAPEPSRSETELIDYVEKRRKAKTSIGYNYDFGDARGVHTIGTTVKDRDGWDEVWRLSDSLIKKNQGTATLKIRTDTGETTITASEWPDIQAAGTLYFQPVYDASWTIKDEIKAGTITKFSEIDNHSAWPW